MPQSRSLPTAAVADACIREAVPFRIASPSIRTLLPGPSVAGPALAVRHAGSVDVFLEAFEGCERGQILVIDNQGRDDEGCIGDLTAIEAQHAGIAAAVIWGRHRDSSEIERIGFPVFSRGTHPAGPNRKKLERGVIGRAKFDSFDVVTGDWVFADADGVLFLEARHAKTIVRAAAGIVDRERIQAKDAANGKTLRQQFRFADYIKKRAQDPSYTLRKHLRVIGGEVEV